MIDIAQLREFIDANPKLITRRESTKYPGLYVIKYTRKVFYDALWNDLLEECRGLVVDADWNVVVRPFQKIYNRFERGVDIPRDEMVIAVRKVNGFMGAITWDRTRDDIIYSTTGSLDSDFAVMVEKHLKCFVPAHHFGFPTTWLFEICDESDPHIIKENLGAYLIGARVISTGKMLSEEILDAVAKAQGYLRPEWKVCRFSDVVQEAKTCKHEGFVAYNKHKKAVFPLGDCIYLGLSDQLHECSSGISVRVWDSNPIYRLIVCVFCIIHTFSSQKSPKSQ